MQSKAPSVMEEGTHQHTGLGKLYGELGLALRPGNGKDLGYWEKDKAIMLGGTARAIQEKRVKCL